MKVIKIIIMTGLIFMFMSGIHLIDLGSSALSIDKGLDLVANTLITQWTPNQIYHIGLIMTMLCFLLLIIMFILEVLKNE